MKKMFETGMSALVLKICSEYAKSLGLNFPPCTQQEINAICEWVDKHTIKDMTISQDGYNVTFTFKTENDVTKEFTFTIPKKVDIDELEKVLKGSDSVVVDRLVDNSGLQVRLAQSVTNQINGKLDKPTNPTAESAVTMTADGTVGTKLLSEIGGGGGEKWYRHDVKITNIKENSNDAFQMSFLSRSGNQTTDISQINKGDGFTQIVSLIGDIKIDIIDGAPDSFPLAESYGYFKGIIYNNNLASLYQIYYLELSVNNAGQDGVPANITHVDTVTEL